MFENIFPIRIYRGKITGLKEAFAQVMPDAEEFWEGEKSAHPDCGPNTFTSYNLGNFLHKHEAFKDVVAQVDVMIADCWKEFNFYRGLTPHIHEFWVNKTLKNSGMLAHQHSPYPLSGVMYANFKPGMGNLVFENPSNIILSMQPVNFDGPDDIHWNTEHIVELEEGDIVMFPGWLRHKTQLNITDEARYIAAFNVGCTGDYPVSMYNSLT